MKKVNDPRGQAAASRTADAKSLSLFGRLHAWHNSRDKGQTIVEFALVMPILLAVLLAIFEIGIFLLNYQTLTQAVNQGGMALQAGQGMSGVSDPCTAVGAAVVGAAGNLKASGTGGIQLQIQIGSHTPTGFSSATGFTCTGQATYVQNGQGVAATVTGTYPCSVITFGFNFAASGCKMTASVQELMQ